MQEIILLRPDGRGYCAMVGNIQMAKCIIGKSRTLLSIGNGSYDLISVVLALTYNPHGTEMARYLYSRRSNAKQWHQRCHVYYPGYFLQNYW